MQGFIALHRELMDKPIWKKSTPEQKSVLITLLLLANHEETEWEWMGQRFKVAPGQFVTSLENLAEKAGVSIQNVRTALLKFSKYEFLTNESTKTGRLITITNWQVYQNLNNRTNKDTNKDLTKTQQRPNKDLTTNNNDNNDNNDNKKDIKDIKDIVRIRFDLFWKEYPKKTGKGKAEESWLKIRPTEELFNTIMVKLGEAKQSRDWIKDNGQFIPNPATWLNQRRWEDEYDTPLPTDQPPPPDEKDVTCAVDYMRDLLNKGHDLSYIQNLDYPIPIKTEALRRLNLDRGP